MPSKPIGIRTLTPAVLCVAMLAACRGQEPEEAGTAGNEINQPPPERLPIAEPPFDRTRLLLAVARAASDHSVGRTNAGAQRLLDGKQFEVRLRFGCDGPGPGDGGHGWSLDPDGRTLRFRVVPTLSLEDQPAKLVADEQVEAVEGFWIQRPWLLQAACPSGSTAVAAKPLAPAATSPADPVGQEGQRIGIAQFFTAEDARTVRRMERPFEAVRQLAEGERVGSNGFDLVLSGRLRTIDGRVILCSGDGPDRPPDCIVSAAVDRVRIERPGDNALMAEWTG